MVKCSFCSENVKSGRGKIYVKVSGQVLNFCNSKCEKNWKMKREGKKTKWTKRFAELKKPAAH